jgi:hypothetical protein
MPLGKDDVAFLESMATPTVCNVIEIVAPDRRGHGYMTRHLHCSGSFTQVAKTVTIRAKNPVPLGGEGYMQKRSDYLDYIAFRPNPSWMVIQDLDDPRGLRRLLGRGAIERA